MNRYNFNFDSLSDCDLLIVFVYFCNLSKCLNSYATIISSKWLHPVQLIIT